MGGKGGTQSAGGDGGNGGSCGDCVHGPAGGRGVGGDAHPSAGSYHQGGGGGGYFGGGSGGRDSGSHDGGGGGGSGYVGGLVPGTGETLNGVNKQPPMTDSPYYASGVGEGKQCDCTGGPVMILQRTFLD